jgi:hypothetical protein
MRALDVPWSELVMTPDLRRSRGSKQFQERLRASIEEIGLAEPLKVALLPTGKYLVVDGNMRLQAINEVRLIDPERFVSIPVYVVSYEQRFEIRYQTDIYQDLVPSQLAALVEHLHKAEHVRKTDIARYIGVSPPTLRNYTGLWRLLQRGGLFARIVELMDVGVLPSSNPYAWLRLTAAGIRRAIEEGLSEGQVADQWIDDIIVRYRNGSVGSLPLKLVESVTGSLPPECYREAREVRTQKRDLGLRRSTTHQRDSTEALSNLARVSRRSPEPVLRSAARSLQVYLQ